MGYSLHEDSLIPKCYVEVLKFPGLQIAVCTRLPLPLGRESGIETNGCDTNSGIPVSSFLSKDASEAAGVVDLPVEDKEGLDSKLPAEKEGEERGGPEVGRRGGICKAAVESIGELRLRVKLKYQATSVNEETPDKSTTFPGSNTSRLTQAGNSSPTLKTATATPHPELLPQLLQGMTFFFTDYQECMDSETIAKWKEVRSTWPQNLIPSLSVPDFVSQLWEDFTCETVPL